MIEIYDIGIKTALLSYVVMINNVCLTCSANNFYNFNGYTK